MVSGAFGNPVHLNFAFPPVTSFDPEHCPASPHPRARERTAPTSPPRIFTTPAFDNSFGNSSGSGPLQPLQPFITAHERPASPSPSTGSVPGAAAAAMAPVVERLGLGRFSASTPQFDARGMSPPADGGGPDGAGAGIHNPSNGHGNGHGHHGGSHAADSEARLASPFTHAGTAGLVAVEVQPGDGLVGGTEEVEGLGSCAAGLFSDYSMRAGLSGAIPSADLGPAYSTLMPPPPPPPAHAFGTPARARVAGTTFGHTAGLSFSPLAVPQEGGSGGAATAAAAMPPPSMNGTNMNMSPSGSLSDHLPRTASLPLLMSAGAVVPQGVSAAIPIAIAGVGTSGRARASTVHTPPAGSMGGAGSGGGGGGSGGGHFRDRAVAQSVDQHFMQHHFSTQQQAQQLQVLQQLQQQHQQQQQFGFHHSDGGGAPASTAQQFVGSLSPGRPCFPSLLQPGPAAAAAGAAAVASTPERGVNCNGAEGVTLQVQLPDLLSPRRLDAEAFTSGGSGNAGGSGSGSGGGVAPMSCRGPEPTQRLAASPLGRAGCAGLGEAGAHDQQRQHPQQHQQQHQPQSQGNGEPRALRYNNHDHTSHGHGYNYNHNSNHGGAADEEEEEEDRAMDMEDRDSSITSSSCGQQQPHHHHHHQVLLTTARSGLGRHGRHGRSDTDGDEEYMDAVEVQHDDGDHVSDVQYQSDLNYQHQQQRRQQQQQGRSLGGAGPHPQLLQRPQQQQEQYPQQHHQSPHHSLQHNYAPVLASPQHQHHSHEQLHTLGGAGAAVVIAAASPQHGYAPTSPQHGYAPTSPERHYPAASPAHHYPAAEAAGPTYHIAQHQGQHPQQHGPQDPQHHQHVYVGQEDHDEVLEEEEVEVEQEEDEGVQDAEVRLEEEEEVLEDEEEEDDEEEHGGYGAHGGHGVAGLGPGVRYSQGGGLGTTAGWAGPAAPYVSSYAMEHHYCVNCTRPYWGSVCRYCNHPAASEVVSPGVLAAAVQCMAEGEAALAAAAGAAAAAAAAGGTAAVAPPGQEAGAGGSCLGRGEGVLLAYDDRCRSHLEETSPGQSADKGRSHPERPERVAAIMVRLYASGLLNRFERITGREASLEELVAVHDAELVTELTAATEAAARAAERAAARAAGVVGGGVMGDNDMGGVDAYGARRSPHVLDCYFNASTAGCARLAAGSAADVARRVYAGTARHGAAIIRPPGHHAESSVAMGFCYYNNAAVAARSAQAAGARRVVIMDWDVHHGNGTQRIFYDDPSVLYMSTHRYDYGTYYPGTGDASEVGSGAGTGFTVNVPWNCGGVSDADMLAAFRHVILPVASEFRPDLIIVSAGFDAVDGDPLGGCRVTPAAFGYFTALLASLAPSVLLLEGGYNLTATAAATEACLRVLLGEAAPPLAAAAAVEDGGGGGEAWAASGLDGVSDSALDSLRLALRVQSGYWESARQSRAVVEAAVEERRQQQLARMRALAAAQAALVPAQQPHEGWGWHVMSAPQPAAATAPQTPQHGEAAAAAAAAESALAATSGGSGSYGQEAAAAAAVAATRSPSPPPPPPPPPLQEQHHQQHEQYQQYQQHQQYQQLELQSHQQHEQEQHQQQILEGDPRTHATLFGGRLGDGYVEDEEERERRRRAMDVSMSGVLDFGEPLHEEEEEEEERDGEDAHMS